MKKRVLILAGYYYPSVKAGGPVQSIKNLVDFLGDTYDFYVLANDRDIGDESSFQNIKLNQWEKVGKAKVYYINYNKISGELIAGIIKENDINTLYLNSFFDLRLSIIPLIFYKFKKIKVDKIIIAPRGNFSQGALNLKKYKKKFFLILSKKIKLIDNVMWHATAESEKDDIKSCFGERTKVKVSKNLTADYRDLSYKKVIDKQSGSLKVIFLSRIHPKKNLLYALNLFNHIEGKIEFNIFGPIEDKKYWLKCKEVINELPDNVKVNYKGVIEHTEVLNCFNENHVLLFPTLGENFGHIISEAFIGGCPVIISDQTPWKNLKNEVGYDIPLEKETEFILALQNYINLNNNDYQKISKSSFLFGKKNSNNISDIDDCINLFR